MQNLILLIKSLHYLCDDLKRRKQTDVIPVNAIANDGISIERIAFTDLPDLAEDNQTHRHDSHSFFLLESGSIDIEIDFKRYRIESPSIIYVHPNQVHRTKLSENVTVYSLALTSENLNAEYLDILESITPAKPLMLKPDTFAIICETALLTIKLAERKSDKLYSALLKNSCNALVALFISPYLNEAKPAKKLTRFDAVAKAFREILEHNYVTIKSPAAYAQKLHISTPYLNECIKSATGFSVTHHIQQRVILQAKRLLFHSNQSVKEIAAVLGYDDYPYFSRLFTKVTGMTALAFRNKNLE